MKDIIKELTEGMQRLCAIANRIVSHPEEANLIEKDLLLEDLRRLYDVAIRLREEAGAPLPMQEPKSKEPEEVTMETDEEMLSSTVMATMAAMGVSEEREPVVENKKTDESASSPIPEEKPHDTVMEEPATPRMEDLEPTENSLLFDEVIIEPVAQPEPALSTQNADPIPEVKERVEEQNVTPSYLEPELEPAADEEPVNTTKEAPVEEVVEKVQPEPAEAPKVGTQASLLDYLKRPMEEKPTVRTLGDTLGDAENEERRADSVFNKKVSDLRTVININDKFSFMSELFHNNMKAYNDFILRLNSIDTRDEALLCVNEVSAQYKWDENSLAVQSFYKVFDKKF